MLQGGPRYEVDYNGCPSGKLNQYVVRDHKVQAKMVAGVWGGIRGAIEAEAKLR